MAKKTYQAYYQANVQTSDQLSLIIMLYDGVLRFMKKAVVKIEANEIEDAHHYLVRSKNIVSELLSTLRVEEAGEIGVNLKNLYLYVFKKIVYANLTKKVEPIQESIHILENLNNGWKQLRDQQKAEKVQRINDKKQQLEQRTKRQFTA